MVVHEILLQLFSFIAKSLVQYSYLGAFVISFIGTSTIVLPFLPYFAILPTFTAIPGISLELLTVSAAFGAALGEFVGYFVGYGGRKIVLEKWKKKHKSFGKMEEFFKKYGFWAIFFFAVTPLPDDVVGLIGGSMGYNKTKFLFASFLGKLVLTASIIYGADTIIGYFRHLLPI